MAAFKAEIPAAYWTDPGTGGGHEGATVEIEVDDVESGNTQLHIAHPDGSMTSLDWAELMRTVAALVALERT